MYPKVILTIAALWTAASPIAFSNTITIPFKLVGKLIVIEATAGGQTGNFILDTGNADLVLDAYHFNGQASGRQLSGLDGRSVAVSFTRANLILGGQKWWAVEAMLHPLEHLEQNKDISFLGIIGTKIFAEHQLTIDYQKREVLLRKGQRNDPLGVDDRGRHPDAVFTFHWKAGIPTIEAQLEHTVLHLGVDTGAEINLLDPAIVQSIRDYVQPAGIMRLIGMTRQPRKVQLANLYNLRIADQICPELKVAIHSLNHLNRRTAKGKGDLDGLIGYEFLSRFRLTFHFKKQEIYLWEREGSEGVLVAVDENRGTDEPRNR